MAEATTPTPSHEVDAATLKRVIFASSLGTLFEWYDFYLYGSLAVFFGSKFFPPGNETAQLLASLATFGAGFGVRPLGALVFGHIGDLIGRKYTFLVTMATMGLSTALVGFLPSYEQIGLTATVILVLLRLLQGLALGGEYGGAATYVAEHVPDHRRGYYTSYIQTTATLGFFISMGVIGTCRFGFGEEAFKAWGWRVPFLISFALLAVSLYIRVKMQESPLFARLKTAKQVSANPLKESFTNPVNLRYVLLALFGATAGQGVVWYTGQFYALTFLQTTLKLHWLPAYLIISAALALGTPFFLLFGHLSDRFGRKRIMMAGCLLAALTYVPIYMAMKACTPALPAGAKAIELAAFPAANLVSMILLVFVQILYVTMVYGPIAAFLVELFPTRVRYTSMSLPYHLGNGWFGGFLPLIATAVAASPATRAAFGDSAIYAGLAYPILVALLTVGVGGLLIRETKDHRIDTALRLGGEDGPAFAWGPVLGALALGLGVFLPLDGGFRADLGQLGLLRALWGHLWIPLVAALLLVALPTLLFLLGHGLRQTLARLLPALALSGLAAAFLAPRLAASGGLARFAAPVLLLALHALVLGFAYAVGRPAPALQDLEDTP